MPNAVIDACGEVKFQLALDVLRRFGEARLPVSGVSMLPTIRPGDILEVRRHAVSAIAPGDVVVFARQGFLVVHRVVELIEEPHRTLLLTRGDRERICDPPVAPEELLGRVTAVERGRRRRPSARLSFLDRMLAHILCRSELCTRVLLRLDRIRRGLPPREALWVN